MVKTAFIITVGFLISLSACARPVPKDSSTTSPEPSPTFAFNKFGSADLDITFCSPDGTPQKMDLYYPNAGGPWPVVLYVHGGSWMEGDKAEGAGWRGLNDEGYLVVSVNYRLAGEDKFPVMIEDVKCAVRYLRTHSAAYNLDPDRIGTIGASAGGHLVSLLGAADESANWDIGEDPDHSSQVQAVVSMSGIYDFTVKLPAGIGSPIYYAFGALAGKASAEMIAASPVSYIDAEDPPFLILHGTQDGAIPVEQAEIFYAALTNQGVPVELVIVENGDHGLQALPGKETTPSRDEINQTILEFLEKNLK